MNRTSIEWVKNPDGTQGYTWNPITGCLNNCPYCYARKLANGRLRPRYLANDNVAPIYPNIEGTRIKARDLDPFYPRFWPERSDDAFNYHCGKPKGIFVCDMSDLFGIGIPEEWTLNVMHVIEHRDQDRFYLLTKQPQNLIKFSPFPDNCWVGVTATDTSILYRALFYLADIKAKVRYISIEPFLNWSLEGYSPNGLAASLKVAVDWVIIGAQTKPYKPPKIEWVQEIVAACDKAGIPVFLKDNLSPIFAKNDCKLFAEYRDKLFTFKDFELEGKTRWHLRQEMPK